MPTCTRAPRRSEILADFAGERLDYWVTGFGTGGTLKGVARVLKQATPATKIIAAEPDNSPVLGSGIPQPRDADGAPSASHPRFRPHLMQGWAPDFISRLTEDAVAAADRRDRAGRRRRCAAPGARTRRAGRHLRRHLERRDARRGARRSRAARRPAPTSSACCPTPASAICRRRCSTDIGDDMTATSSRCRARRRATASTRRRRGACRPRADARAGALMLDATRSASSTRARPRRAGGDVRARVVRVLLVGAQAVRAARHRVPQRRPRLGRVPGRATSAARSAPCSRDRTGARPSRRSSSAASTSAAARTCSTRGATGRMQRGSTRARRRLRRERRDRSVRAAAEVAAAAQDGLTIRLSTSLESHFGSIHFKRRRPAEASFVAGPTFATASRKSPMSMTLP